MNIQTHAYKLKCNASVRFKKQDVPRTIEDLYNAADDTSVKEKLALLYSTMTPKPAVKNNPLAWVAIATDPNCDRNHLLDKMVVARGYAIGCDGFRIHGYKLPASQAADLDGQYIDASGNILAIEKRNNCQLPMENILKMLVEAEYPLTDTFDISKCTVEDIQFFALELFGKSCRFNKKMIEQAFNGRQSVQVCTTTEFNGQQPVRFMISDTEAAIVMPVRLPK